MGIADFIALSAITFAGGFSFAFNQPAIGCKVLYRAKAGDITNLIQYGECQNATNTGETGKDMVITATMMFRMLFNKTFNGAEFVFVKRNNIKVEVDIALYTIIVKAVSRAKSYRKFRSIGGKLY